MMKALLVLFLSIKVAAGAEAPEPLEAASPNATANATSTQDPGTPAFPLNLNSALNALPDLGQVGLGAYRDFVLFPKLGEARETADLLFRTGADEWAWAAQFRADAWQQQVYQTSSAARALERLSQGLAVLEGGSLALETYQRTGDPLEALTKGGVGGVTSFVLGPFPFLVDAADGVLSWSGASSQRPLAQWSRDRLFSPRYWGNSAWGAVSWGRDGLAGAGDGLGKGAPLDQAAKGLGRWAGQGLGGALSWGADLLGSGWDALWQGWNRSDAAAPKRTKAR